MDEHLVEYYSEMSRLNNLIKNEVLRDKFATAALSGLVPLPWSFGGDDQKVAKYVDDIAKTVYLIADAMLEERKKREE
jgi:hypothetical protein